jgi:hypothetical protein
MTSLAKPMKEQILVNLQALQTAGMLRSIVSLDKTANPLDTVAAQGYPLAIVSMPRITADFEDQANNLRTYRYDILFVIDPDKLKNADTDVEDLIDAALNQFDTNFTLEGTAVAAVLPAELDGGPVSTGSKNLLCFDVILKARTLYQTGT